MRQANEKKSVPQGFTLVEVVIGMVIIGVVASIVIGASHNNWTVTVRSYELSSANTIAANALEGSKAALSTETQFNAIVQQIADNGDQYTVSLSPVVEKNTEYSRTVLYTPHINGNIRVTATVGWQDNSGSEHSHNLSLVVSSPVL